MQTSKRGFDLIKKYEGLRLTAYKPVASEKYYTIGYGHYGKEVKANQTINRLVADWLLLCDVADCEKAVNKYVDRYKFNQNEYDALVSFTFNLGAGNLDKLTDYGRRNKETIANKILAYNKAGGKVLNGLVKRRQEEHGLFMRK